MRRPTEGRPTIKAVATHAGVGVSTVSRVVNGGRTSEAVRQRVLASIAELGYTPSVAAQALVTGRTGTVGLAINTTQSSWFGQILAGVEEALLPGRMSVLLASLMLSGSYDASAVLAWIQERRVDGLILVRYSERDRHLLEASAAAGLPVALVAPDVRAPEGFSIRCDNLQAGRLVAEHLATLGHRSIAFAGGPSESIDTRERLDGLGDGMARAGLPEPAEVWFGPGYTTEAGELYAQRFLAADPSRRPTAVVLGNDAMAIGFMHVVLESGLRLPRDVSVVGFDGTPDGELFWPRLTTVKQPTRLMAREACRTLLGTISGQNALETAPGLEYAVELVARSSTGAPRGVVIGQGARALPSRPEEG